MLENVQKPVPTLSGKPLTRSNGGGSVDALRPLGHAQRPLGQDSSPPIEIGNTADTHDTDTRNLSHPHAIQSCVLGMQRTTVTAVIVGLADLVKNQV